MQRTVAILLSASILGVISCGIVDRFSDRAVQYNLEAEQVQDQGILLNILRASKRRPLEFNGITTVAGSATASGQVGLTLPLSPFGNGTVLNPMGTLSGGPTFNMSVVDTQEFYNGLLTPISGKTLDLYYRQRYSRTLLFNVFITAIVIKQHGHTFEIPNYVGNDRQLDQFQFTVEYLLNLGMETQTRKKSTDMSRLFTADELRDLSGVARSANAGLEVKSVSWCDLSADEQLTALSELKSEHPKDTSKKATLENLACVCGGGWRSHECRPTPAPKPTPTATCVVPTATPTCTATSTMEPISVPTIAAPTFTPTDVPTPFPVPTTTPTPTSTPTPETLGAIAADLGLPPALYRAEKPGDDSFEICFQPPSCPAPASPVFTALCGGKDDSTAKSPVVSKALSAENLSLGAELTGGLLAIDDLYTGCNNLLEHGCEPPSADPYSASTKWIDLTWKIRLKNQSLYKGIDFSQPVDLQLIPRSTEGIVYYLGEITRRRLYPDPQNNKPVPGRTIFVKYGPAGGPIPYGICRDGPKPVPTGDSNYRCEPIFVLDQFPDRKLNNLNDFFSVSYDGYRYAVPGRIGLVSTPAEFDDDSVFPEAGRTSELMELVAELVGLNKAAKNVPASSVFTITGAP